MLWSGWSGELGGCLKDEVEVRERDASSRNLGAAFAEWKLSLLQTCFAIGGSKIATFQSGFD